MAKQVLAVGETGQQLVDKFNNNADDLYAYHLLDDELVKWAQGKNYEQVVITRDSEGRVTSMTVLWPDNSVGVYTSTDYNATHEAYDGYNITHTNSGKTVTQTAVTRDTEGAVIIKPALTVA